MKKRNKAISPAGRPARATPRRPAKRKVIAKRPAPALALAQQCVLTEVDSLQSALGKVLASDTVTIDITGLKRIDTAGMQVIAAFVRERAMHARPVRWRGTSAALSTAARLLGLTKVLELPASATASSGAPPAGESP